MAGTAPDSAPRGLPTDWVDEDITSAVAAVLVAAGLALAGVVMTAWYGRWAVKHWEEIERYERQNPYR